MCKGLLYPNKAQAWKLESRVASGKMHHILMSLVYATLVWIYLSTCCFVNDLWCVCFISYGQKWHLLFLWYFPAASYTGLMYNKSKKTCWLIRTDLGFRLSLSEKESFNFFPLCIVLCTNHDHVNPVLCGKLTYFTQECMKNKTEEFSPWEAFRKHHWF